MGAAVSRVGIKLNHAGMAQMLKSVEVGGAVDDLAERVAEAVNSQGRVAHAGYGSMGPEIVATVKRTMTDRQKAVVIIQHPAAAAMQAKYGILTRAAASVGAEVTS